MTHLPASVRGVGETGHGVLVAASGPVCRARGLDGAAVNEVVRVGQRRLLGEVIHLDEELATIQVYEETGGLTVGDPVERTGAPLRAWLGPGLLGATFDGLQRPLDRLAAAGHWLLLPGEGADLASAGDPALGPVAAADREPGVAPEPRAALDRPGPPAEIRAVLGARRWRFEASRTGGDRVAAGDLVGEIPEGPLRNRVLVPPGTPPGRLRDIRSGEVAVDEPVAIIETEAGAIPLLAAHSWPVRTPRPVLRRLPLGEPLVTGTRVIDMVFPVARGGTAIIPGGFGTGKTVVEQSLARWSDADIVVYVGCGERGNEMADLLSTFPELVDPRSGRPLLDRTVLVANTSNMPVAAREASIQLGITIAEYFRDQGFHVALLADSTSRWAEALREISGRLEELPGEEGFPAYLASRLAAFYERAGRVQAIGSPRREGSVTIVGAVSPPGGDFSEPVTQASLRLAGTFWGLDTELAHARHFPAIDWRQSYSLYVDGLAGWYAEQVDPGWSDARAEAIELLGRERQLLDIVQLVGVDALPEHDRVLLEVARIMRETFLQQHALDPVDASRPPVVQLALLRAVLAARTGMLAALEAGASLEEATTAPVLAELRRAKAWGGDDLVARLAALEGRVRRLEVRAPEPEASEPEAPGLADAGSGAPDAGSGALGGTDSALDVPSSADSGRLP